MLEQGFNFSWVAALILAVPLAIMGNLLTRAVERWLENRPQKKFSSRVKTLRYRIERAEKVKETFPEATDYLVHQIALSGIITAYFASFAAMLFGASQLLVISARSQLLEPELLEHLTILGTLVAAQGGLLAVSILLRGTRVARWIRTLDQERKELQELEAQVGAAA